MISQLVPLWAGKCDRKPMVDTESKQPSTARRFARDLRVATTFLTRLPVRGAEGVLADACWAFPLVGLLVGMIGGTVFGLALWFGLPSLPAALLALAAMATITGALHEDGLADTADGFGGGATPLQRLEIMRDSRSGAFGVLALIFSVALRATALAAIADTPVAIGALVAAGALSRGLLPAMMCALPLASRNGLAAAAGRPDSGAAWTAGACGVAAALVLLGVETGIGALVLSAVAISGLASLARRKIGGYNGDTLGAAQQISEIAVLVAAAAS
jgi:adenosylcobinamide-GDP ribazoletransferase